MVWKFSSFLERKFEIIFSNIGFWKNFPGTCKDFFQIIVVVIGVVVEQKETIDTCFFCHFTSHRKRAVPVALFLHVFVFGILCIVEQNVGTFCKADQALIAPDVAFRIICKYHTLMVRLFQTVKIGSALGV